MSLALNRENFVWHKLHSLTGIIPVGFYMLQHLTLNSFSIAGERNFNGVISFFGSMPPYVLLAAEVLLIWLPLLFHAVYGLFITNRGQMNYKGKYKWSQNLMYSLQRYSGIFLFLFLVYHVATTSVLKYVTHDENTIMYGAWHAKLTTMPWGPVWTVVYLLGILTASYHLSFGVWNFCIRWGITISEQAQLRVQKFAVCMFVVVTLLGWAALAGFFLHEPAPIIV